MKRRRKTYTALRLPEDEPAEVVVYVAPNRAAPDSYTVLAPLGDRRLFIGGLEKGRLTIRTYEQCARVPKEAIQQQLMDQVQGLHAAARVNRMAFGVAAGVLAAAAAGSWIAADPVWLLDELLLPAGAAAGYVGYRVMERRSTRCELFTQHLPEKIAHPTLVVCPLLTGLYAKMELWAADRIEEAVVDADWVQQVVLDSDLGSREPIALAQALDDHLGLARMMQRRPTSDASHAGAKKLRQRAKKEKGVSEGALHVYGMFCQAVLPEHE